MRVTPHFFFGYLIYLIYLCVLKLKTMKKLIICLLVAITLTNCEIGVQKSNAEIPTYHVMNTYTNGSNTVIQSTHNWNGMQYRIMASYQGGIAVINLTRDSLEVELLRKQIEILNK